jgi:hypothetical protein
MKDDVLTENITYRSHINENNDLQPPYLPPMYTGKQLQIFEVHLLSLQLCTFIQDRKISERDI